ncbi:MAG TPA: serine hydrolase [Candidatus Rubrimentiphilum sp.]|nr:serine hydrolase [Candidatus Rubrimentiphilum sp.]
MNLFRDPGLSVAVIHNFQIDWAKGYGVVERGSSVPVLPSTLFQAGSISKVVTAAGALSLVEQGALNLDEDVNKRLVSWHVPDNEFTAVEKVTLRRILSQRSGMTVHGFDGYVPGSAVPTLIEILNGEKPATNVPVRVDLIPGSKWRYSGGAVEVEQQLMEDVTGKSFPVLMKELVFDRVGMDNSTFAEPLPADWAARAASGTTFDGTTVEGKRQVMPQMAAAGLWTTATDLAKLAINIALSKRGVYHGLLSEATSREMLTPTGAVGEIALGNMQHVDQMGLGFFLGDASRPDLFGHIGDDPGFQGTLMMFADSGDGLVVLGNSQNAIVLSDYLQERVADAYGWKAYVAPDRFRVGLGEALEVVAARHGTAAALRAFLSVKKMPGANPVRYQPTQNTLIRLGYALLMQKKLPDAIAVMKTEVAQYPRYWNAYDSLGEMYADAGDTRNAIANYKKAIELNPQSDGSREALKRLQPAKVMILGVAHLVAKRDVHNSVFQDSPLSPKRQAQISDIVTRLARFHPTKVLIEADMGDPVFAERYRQYLGGQFALTANEVYQFGFRLAKVAGNPTIYPVDTDGPQLYTEKSPEAAVMTPYLDKNFTNVSDSRFDAFLARSNALETTGTYLDLLRYLNSDAAIRANASWYSIFDGMGREADNAGAAYVAQWYVRNSYIFSNILSVIQPGDRVVVMMGQGHEYLLREFVRLDPNLVDVDPLSYLR